MCSLFFGSNTFCVLLNCFAWYHNLMTTTNAFQSKICSYTKYFPLTTPTWMWLLQLNNISNVIFHITLTHVVKYPRSINLRILIISTPYLLEMHNHKGLPYWILLKLISFFGLALILPPLYHKLQVFVCYKCIILLLNMFQKTY